MRRHNFELFMPNTYEGLLADCIYYCWEKAAISDMECWQLDRYIKDLYIEKNKKYKSEVKE